MVRPSNHAWTRIAARGTHFGSLTIDPCKQIGGELYGGCWAGEVVLTASMQVAKAFLDGPVSQGAGACEQVGLSRDVGSVLVYLSACFA